MRLIGLLRAGGIVTGIEKKSRLIKNKSEAFFEI
jgi:hypothetical protein